MTTPLRVLTLTLASCVFACSAPLRTSGDAMVLEAGAGGEPAPDEEQERDSSVPGSASDADVSRAEGGALWLRLVSSIAQSSLAS